MKYFNFRSKIHLDHPILQIYVRVYKDRYLHSALSTEFLSISGELHDPTWHVKDKDLIEEGKWWEEEYAAQEEVDKPLLVPPAAPQLLKHVVELQCHRGFTGRENLIEPTTCFFAAKI